MLKKILAMVTVNFFTAKEALKRNLSPITNAEEKLGTEGILHTCINSQSTTRATPQHKVVIYHCLAPLFRAPTVLLQFLFHLGLELIKDGSKQEYFI